VVTKKEAIQTNPQASGSRGPERLSGMPRELRYSLETSQALLAFHQEIVAGCNVENPYYTFTGQGENPLFEGELPNGAWVKIGKIGAFTAEEMARITQELAFNYVMAGTMGKDFPKTDPRSNYELLAIFLGGYDHNRLVVAIEARTNQGIKPLASVQAHSGKSPQTLKELFIPPANPTSEVAQKTSSLATLQAFQITQPSPKLEAFLERYGDTREDRIICMSRLFKQDPETMRLLGMNDKGLPWDTMALLGLAIAGHSLPSSLPPELVIYDTARIIQNKLNVLFEMQVLASYDEIKPTPVVTKGILSHHYDNWQTDKILVGYGVVSEYLERALQYLKDRDIRVHFSGLDQYQRAMHQIQEFYPQLSQLPLPMQQAFWEMLSKEPGVKDLDPVRNKPVIIDHHTSKGSSEFLEYSQLAEPDLQPFISGAHELHELFEKMSSTPATKDEAIRFMTNQLLAITNGISVKAIMSLLSANTIIDDIVWLKKELTKHAADAQLIEQESRWIWDPLAQTLCHYIGPEAHRLLARSRLIGLVPFATLEQLSTLKIYCGGASAVAHTLDLLAAAGAANITFYDPGKTDPSNGPRFPAQMGGYPQYGQSKAQVLQGLMQGRNPYGDYRGYLGRVVPTAESQPGPFDITFENLCEDADLLFEVVDNPTIKVGLRQFLRDHYPNLPLIFLADVGSSPFVGLELGATNNPFNQGLSANQVEAMLYPPEMNLKSALSSVYQMLKHNFPAEHVVQFLSVVATLVPFWSQSPISAHESAAVAMKLILGHLSGATVVGENIHPHQAVQTLMPTYTAEQQATLAVLTAQIFRSAS